MEGVVKASIQIKYDWYQTDELVVITILTKNIDKDNALITFTENTVNVKLSLPCGEIHSRLLKLSHEIVPHCCNYRITPTMAEVKLRKAEGIRWDSLEVPVITKVPTDIVAAATTGPPAYPTSKPGKDWAAVEKDLKEQEANEKLIGEEALNKLFQGIYGNGSDDVKRAMNKSYLESGGTVLSTNWSEIEKEHVQIKPPEGTEYKKWNS